MSILAAPPFAPPAPIEPVHVPDEPLYELIDDQRVDLPPMSTNAARLATRLGRYLGTFVEQNALGEVMIETLFLVSARRKTGRRPDVAFISAARWPLDRETGDEAAWDVVPDLAIDVLSPNDRYFAVMDKLREYMHYGVRQVWLVLPPLRQIYVYDGVGSVRIYSEADTLEGGLLLPGFRLELRQLFRNIKSEIPELETDA